MRATSQSPLRVREGRSLGSTTAFPLWIPFFLSSFRFWLLVFFLFRGASSRKCAASLLLWQLFESLFCLSSKLAGKLRAAVEAKDEKEIRVHLHTLKGVSAQVGASTVSEIALTMEKAKKVVSDVKKLKILDITIAQTIELFDARQ